jgi:hypothetical protein
MDKEVNVNIRHVNTQEEQSTLREITVVFYTTTDDIQNTLQIDKGTTHSVISMSTTTNTYTPSTEEDRSNTTIIIGNFKADSYQVNLNYIYFLCLLLLLIPLSIYTLNMYKRRKNNTAIRQRAITLAGVYRETCTTEPYEYHNDKMNNTSLDSSFSSVENDYASIATLPQAGDEYLEPRQLVRI